MASVEGKDFEVRISGDKRPEPSNGCDSVRTAPGRVCLSEGVAKLEQETRELTRLLHCQNRDMEGMSSHIGDLKHEIAILQKLLRKP